MYKRIYPAIISTFLIFIIFACKDDTVIQRFCTGTPVVPFGRARLILTTDIVSDKEVMVDGSGFFRGENFEIERNGLRKSANITGYICEDLGITAEVTYNDTANTSKLKISGYYTSGGLFYSPNTETDTAYTVIGGYGGFITGNHGYGQFTTPLFSGDYSYFLLSR